MTRVGFFNAKPTWTTEHWTDVLSRPEFLQALKMTLILACISGFVSPLIFSILAYIIIRTRVLGHRPR